MIGILSGSLEVTVDFLTEIDKLVQLIESPIFTYLRLELLEVPHNQHLVQALYGLLMLLPQTEAFHTLRRRLDCVPSLHLHCASAKDTLVGCEAMPHLSPSHPPSHEIGFRLAIDRAKGPKTRTGTTSSPRPTPVAKTEVCNKHEKHINFDELLAHFLSVQERHHQTKQSSRAVTLLEKGVRNTDT
ncbi:unnamed protein product [Timema podura]|uniref:Vacuolar protein 14 C-terminal Fig4-binding domain-containing protein n=1 Tax=Timema podura TaxID=61482 RepID=A0ABN7PAF6_TIMPD|nr:unnamed protein product [Timema podura]